jgi:hypothetical protein
MVNLNPDEAEPTDLDRIARSADDVRDGWQRTLEDCRAMIADREGDGFETFLLPAGDTAPRAPEDEDTEPWGLSYVVPGDRAEESIAFVEASEFTETAVYQSRERGTAFVVTECIDPEARRSLFVAGAYRVRFAAPLVRAAVDREEMHTLVRTLDGTLVHVFDHDHPESFFPDPEAFYAYDTDGFYRTD